MCYIAMPTKGEKFGFVHMAEIVGKSFSAVSSITLSFSECIPYKNTSDNCTETLFFRRLCARGGCFYRGSTCKASSTDA